MARKFNALNSSNMRALKAGQALTEHGISFARCPDGDGRFSINIMVDGRRIHRVIGKESEGTTRTQAEEAIARLRSEAREGRLSLPKGRKNALMFKQAAHDYLAKLREEGGRDMRMKIMRLNHHLVPFLGKLPLSKIATFDVERFKKYRRGEGAAEGTVNRELAVLSHLFTKAIEWGWLTAKPAVVRRFKEGTGRITYLTREHIERLLEAASRDQNLHIYPFILIGLETGMRRMEILSIRLADIDVDKQVIHIPQAKAGARLQPMTARLAQFLKEYMQDVEPGQEWLFPAPTSKTGHVVAIEKPFRRVVAAAGLDVHEVVRHTLRHTAITHLVQAGVDLPTVKRISGHKTLAMVERYSHQNGAHIKEAMSKLEQRYRKST